jgi:hypothetical protein
MASSCSAASAGALLAARPRTVISIVLAKVDDEQVTRLRTFEVHRPRERVDKIQGDVADVRRPDAEMELAIEGVARLDRHLATGVAGHPGRDVGMPAVVPARGLNCRRDRAI